MWKCEYFGHIIRRPNRIQRLLLEAWIDGKRGRGRPRTVWIDNIKEWLNLSYKECIRNAENREKWRSHIIQPAESRWNLMMMMSLSFNFSPNSIFKPFPIFIVLMKSSCLPTSSTPCIICVGVQEVWSDSVITYAIGSFIWKLIYILHSWDW